MVILFRRKKLVIFLLIVATFFIWTYIKVKPFLPSSSPTATMEQRILYIILQQRFQHIIPFKEQMPDALPVLGLEGKGIKNKHKYLNEDGSLELFNWERESVRYLPYEVTDFIDRRWDNSTLDDVKSWCEQGYVSFVSNEDELKSVLQLFVDIRASNAAVPLLLIGNEETRQLMEDIDRGFSSLVKSLNIKTVQEDPQYPGKLTVFTLKSYHRLIYVAPKLRLKERSTLDHLFDLPPAHLTLPARLPVLKEKNVTTLFTEGNSVGMPVRQKDIHDRNEELHKILSEILAPFIKLSDSKLHNLSLSRVNMETKDKVNVRNILNTLYNSLPSISSDVENRLQLSLDSVFVVQPSDILLNEITPLIFKSEILFNIPHLTFLQRDSMEDKTLSFEFRVEEVPWLLLLPYQSYGPKLSELESVGKEKDQSWFCDLNDWPWCNLANEKDLPKEFYEEVMPRLSNPVYTQPFMEKGTQFKLKCYVDDS